MMAELSEKLRGTFGFSENHIQAVLADLRRTSERVEITGKVQVVTADPDDDKFIECALVGGATAIVSGDRHLLALGRYEDIPILSASDFLAGFV
jgi:putative PIN family toxin of toxin-antitoxin system